MKIHFQSSYYKQDETDKLVTNSHECFGTFVRGCSITIRVPEIYIQKAFVKLVLSEKSMTITMESLAKYRISKNLNLKESLLITWSGYRNHISISFEINIQKNTHRHEWSTPKCHSLLV